jgi:hypothetical protein
MIPDLPGIDDLFGWAVDSAASSVFDGIVSWMARGLAVLIEWIWSTLDTATTPRISEPWFTTDLMGPISMLALAVVVALMLASAMQAALAGRPEQIVDAFKQGAWSIVATALSITVVDLLLAVVDEASDGIWATVRPDLQLLLEGVITAMSAGAVTNMGFLAVLMLLFMYLALIGLAVALAMRNALIYVVAFLAPLVFASSVLPLFRDSARKIIHLGVALVLSKLAIVATLTLAVKMMSNATNLTSTGDALQDGVGSLGVLFAGVICFAVASITPMVLYKLMPTVESAVIGAGIAGGWGRSAMAGMYAASTAKNLGGSIAKLASTPIPGGDSAGGGTAGGGSPSGSASPTGGSPATAAAATAPTSAASATGSASSGTTSGTGAGVGGASGTGAGGGAGGAAGSSAGAGAAVAAPVMVATAAVNAPKSGTAKIGEVSDATLDAAAARHPSAHRRQPASTGSSSDAPATDTGSKGSPASSRVPTGEGS